MAEEPVDLYDTVSLSAAQVAPKAAARMRRWRDSTEPDGYSTGLRTLDEGMFRLLMGELLVLGAGPGMGKTSVALSIAQSVALELMAKDDPGVVLFYTCEMTNEELLLRLASINSGVNLQGARSKRVSAGDYDELEDALEKAEKLPLIVNQSSSPDTALIHGEIERLSKTGPIKRPVRLLVIDYLELLSDSTQDSRAQEWQRIASIVRRLKALAKYWKIPVIVLSQVTRESQTESLTKIPMISQLSGSKAVEAAADKIVFLMRPQYYLAQGQSCACERSSDAENTIYVVVAKDRNGISGITYRLGWAGYCTRIYDKHSSVGRVVKVLAVRSPSEIDTTSLKGS